MFQSLGSSYEISGMEKKAHSGKIPAQGLAACQPVYEHGQNDRCKPEEQQRIEKGKTHTSAFTRRT